MDTQNKTAACGRLRAGPVSESESHESTSLSRLLRQEGLAPQMCVGRVNCDARGMQRGPHPAGEKEGIPRPLHWTVIANCHARGCECGSVGRYCGAAEAESRWGEKLSTYGPTRRITRNCGIFPCHGDLLSVFVCRARCAVDRVSGRG